MYSVKKLLALTLAVTMLATLLLGCKPNDPASSNSEGNTKGSATTSDNNTKQSTASGTLIVANGSMSEKFSPFFAVSEYDSVVADMVTGYLLGIDREGAPLLNGMNGETRTYSGSNKDYTYYTMGDCKVTTNPNGSVDYDITMRDDIKFSDGTSANIDDVIFGLYVALDPTYDGPMSTAALPIEGIKEYHAGMDHRGVVIYEDGETGYKPNEQYTKEQYDTFWSYYNEKAIEEFVKEICDFCVAAGWNEPDDSIAACAANWEYPGLPENATYMDFWNAMMENYDSPQELEAYESGGSDRLTFTLNGLGDDFLAGVVTGNGAPNVSGIQRTGDYSLRIHCTKFDAQAIYHMGFPIVPRAYYGDPNYGYDYANNKFGFPKGELREIKARTTKPLGCGPYAFESYDKETASLVANPYYFAGEPKIKYLKYQNAPPSDYVPGIKSGKFDVATPNFNSTTVNSIKKTNSNGELVGNTLHTILIDNLGYGYIGINSDLIKVGDNGASQESKNLRLAIMTALSVARDSAISSFYGEFAYVIQYPITNTSWAAPRPTDDGYQIAYSKDVNGQPIYTDTMSLEDKHQAAAKAALGYLEAAGYTVENGKVTAAPAGAKGLTESDAYEIVIPGNGQQDHPAYNVAITAKEILHSIGFELKIADLSSEVWDQKLNAETCELWTAGWNSNMDPDIYQIYHSDNAGGENTASNHYQIRDEKLDQLIFDARSSGNTTYRKSLYRKAFDIIMSWGIELPLYQRKNPTVFSAERIDIATLPEDMTTFYGWDSEIENLQVK